jgi:hypothetical protein
MGTSWDIDQRQAALVVFKHSRPNQTVLDERKVQLGSNLLQQGPHGQQLPHGHAEGHILSSSGGQANLILQLGGPQDGAPTQGEHKPSSGLDRGWELVILIPMQSTEVGIHPAVQAFIWFWHKL